MEFFLFVDWLYTVVIGFLVVSYWRCTWVLMDIWLCDQGPDADLAANGDSFCFAYLALTEQDTFYRELRVQSAGISYGIGIACLVVGVTCMWMGLWLPIESDKLGTTDASKATITWLTTVRRFVILYILGFSCVNIWRGVWYWADDWILPNNPLGSYWLTSLAGAGLAFAIWGGNSLLAPPAIFLLDGPGLSPPPIAVTLLQSHYEVSLPYNEEPPELGLPIRILDIVVSFILLPFGVVWFWRGTWLLFDWYFWGFSVEPNDVHWSLLWNTIFAVVAYFICSEPVVAALTNWIPEENHLLNGTALRLRTYVLAWGTVSYWRLVWLIWDEFLGGTTVLSALLGHALSILTLLSMGCMACICAPASTLGVDSVPNPKAADAPLFANVPVPYDLLQLFAMGRQPDIGEIVYEGEEGEGDKEKLSKINEEGEIEMVPPPSKSKKDLEEQGEEQIYAPPAATDDAGGSSARRPKGGKYSSRTTSCPPRVEGETHLSYLSRRTYGEMQRPGVGSSRKVYSEIQTRPTESNKRTRSKFFRSR